MFPQPLNTYELVEPFLMAVKHISQVFSHCYKKETGQIIHKTRHEVTLFLRSWKIPIKILPFVTNLSKNKKFC